MGREMHIDAAVKAASKVLPSNPDYERYLDGLLSRLTPEDRHTLAQEGLATMATRMRRHRARNAARRRDPGAPGG